MKFIKTFFLSTIIFMVATIAAKNIMLTNENTFEGYDKAWASVEKLDEKGLPQSAYDKVKDILDFAKEENNQVQIIKATIYSCKYISTLEEDGDIKAIEYLEKNIVSESVPAKNIMQSMLAEMYQNYYQQNSWRFYNRSAMQTATDDIRTWDLSTLVSKTKELYIQSVSDIDVLQKALLIPYEELLITGDKESKLIRPTLYDLLAHRAFDYFANNETYLTQPAYVFKIDNPEYLSDNKNFASLNILSADSTADKLYALRLMQELITFHLKDPEPTALIQADIKRLQFVKQNAVFAFKDSLYLNALQAAEKKYIQHPASADYSYEIAQQLYDQSAAYNPFYNIDVQMDAAKALEVCDSTIAHYPKSTGGINCAALKQIILDKTIQITTEKYNVPDLPFRALVEWKNVPVAYMHLIKLSEKELESLNATDYDSKAKFLSKIKSYKQWQQKLPQTNDYQNHSAEIKVDALKNGIYVLVASSESDFANNTAVVSYGVINITNISYITNALPTGGNNFYVLDRMDGTPLINAEAQTFYQIYDNKSKKYIYTPGIKYYSDNKGAFFIPSAEAENNYLKIEINYKGDTLYNEQYFYIQRPENKSINKFTSTFFFTDRSIYRPGQTIYFKGIMLENAANGKSKNVLSNYSTELGFYDVNNQLISKVTLTTNEYGSFSGTFSAPQGGITGEMFLRNESGMQTISVEEYKRPTFYVKSEKLNGTYTLGDTITVKGTAMNYSGAVVDNAAVRYRVIRKARFPYPMPYYYKSIYPRQADLEITNGFTTTNSSGVFEISFAALADKEINKKLKPEFMYEVIAEVTDISGETRTSTTTVVAGYIGIKADMELPETASKDSSFAVKITTTNLNDTEVSATGTVTIYPLTAPDKLYRNRLWSQPDLFTMTKKEYVALFPIDLYADENNMQKWVFGESVQRADFNTSQNSEVILNPQLWNAGAYKIVLVTKDDKGNEIKVEKYMRITDKKNTDVIKQYLRSTDSEFTSQPGNKINIHLNSDVSDARILFVVSRPDTPVSYNWYTLKNKINEFTIPVYENDFGGIDITAYMVNDNRIHQISWRINVPWNEKQLSVTLETHRNLLEPGENETWKIKVAGPKGDAVAAEILASMYDKSLDAFKGNNWNFISWPINYNSPRISDNNMFIIVQGMQIDNNRNEYPTFKYYNFDQLNWFGYNMYYYGRNYDGVALEEVMVVNDGGNRKNKKSDKNAAPPAESTDDMESFDSIQNTEEETTDNFNQLDNVPLRKNFNETAFFYPHLETDSNGVAVFSFTMPEALTEWKFTALAHTTDLLSGFAYSSVITQKELMITPNMPRFFRTGDTIIIAAKIQNLSDTLQTGIAQLELFNALNMQNVDSAFINTNKQVTFSVLPKQSVAVSWQLNIPAEIQAVQYQLKASAEKFTDGEQNVLPVLSNTMLVTESMPLWVRAGKTTDFVFTKLLNASSSSTLQHQRLTLEYTSNPVWSAVQSLPYLMEYPYECAEQVFSRYYANSIATHITQSKPEIKNVFDQWNAAPNSLTSNLEKNQQLKSLLLEETPWVLQAKDETERKKRIALLFDANKMQMELQTAMLKLQKMQSPSGAWPWFNGMPDSRYITQHIVNGIGHLKKLQVVTQSDIAINSMTTSAINFLDDAMLKDYTDLAKYKTDKKTYHPSTLIIHYLYGRSFYSDMPFPADNYSEAKTYFIGQLKKYWLDHDLYSKGLIALTLYRAGEIETATDIVASLKEFAIEKEDMGMYWKNNTPGYFWYQSPIETQALMIEVFNEITMDKPAVEELKIWLLRNKQTNDWKTTKATAEACYALLLTGNDLLASTELAEITIGGLKIKPDNIEAGTGYFNNTWSGNAIAENMANVSVTGTQSGFSYGAVYWQYFEQLDKITPAETPLKLHKELFKQVNTATGVQLQAITYNTPLEIGDLVQIRIELRSDRDMEYIHLKDMRAACFEPVNVLSSYKWQDGLGYYESTRDASTNFFIERLPTGTYVFEYSLRVSQKGNFSNGITSIQCMYAPEFSAHSEGIRVTVR
ncbi:MAG: alpha-2-macroglobulin family protein [Chitinophagales bacterium]